MFSEEVYQAMVPETFVEGGYLRPEDGFVHVGCLDPDSGEGRNVTYFIAESDPGPFALDNSTGSLSVTADLDYETNPSYTFHVRCSDVDFPSLTDTATVVIIVESVNEYHPEVNPRSIVLTISEDQAVGTIIVSSLPDERGLVTYTVTDMDSGPHGIDSVRYTLSETEGNSENAQDFSLEFTTGALVLNESLDVDNINIAGSFGTIINLRLTVCDVQPALQDCPNLVVKLLVSFANDNSPQFSRDEYRISIPESAPVNYTTTEISCADADKNVGAFEAIEFQNSSLSESTMWGLDRQNGTLTLKQPLDYETAEKQFEFVLRCLDNDGLEDFARVVIIVEPVNDIPPQFNQTEYSFTVERIDASDSYTVGQVNAYDLDQDTGNVITYSIEENSNFNIDPADGTITVVDYILAIEGSTFNLTVEASDGKFTNQVTVTIDVVGPLSVLEIIVVSAAGFLLILIPLIIVCCCVIRVQCRSHETEAPMREGAVTMIECPAYRDTNLNVRIDEDGYAIPNIPTSKPTTGDWDESEYECMKPLPQYAQDKAPQNDYRYTTTST